MTAHAVFDLDGTLVDSVAICTTILNDMLGHRGSGRRLCAAETRPHVSAGGERMIMALLGAECGDPAREIADFRARYAAAPTLEDSLYPGVREGLLELRDAGVTLSICSNKPQQLCEKVIGELGLAPLFRAVAGGAPGIPAKPAPDLFHRAIGAAGAKLRDCCFIGDGEPDHVLATRLRVPFIWISYGYADPAWDFGDSPRCGRFAEVPALVRRLLLREGPRAAA